MSDMNDTDTPELPEAVTVNLPVGIPIDSVRARRIELVRCPTGRDLGRHTFTDLMMGDIKALSSVVPRLSSPYLHPKLIKEADGRDVNALCQGFAAFFEGVDMDGLATPSVPTPSTMTTPPTAMTSIRTIGSTASAVTSSPSPKAD